MQRIESKANATLKLVRSLGQKKYRDQSGYYVAEGWRAVHDMVDSPSLAYILVEEAQLDKPEWQQLEAKISVPVYVLTNGLDHRLAFTDHSQGVWAVFRQAVASLESVVHESMSEGMYLLLDCVQDPGNLGTIIRTALAAGVRAVFLTKGSVDIYNPKTVRSTMSALTKLPIVTGITDTQLQALFKNPIWTPYALTPHGAVSYEKIKYAPCSLLVLGNEGQGIRQSVMEQIPNRIVIPMYGPMESLNLSVAAAVAMYKVAEQQHQ